MADVSLWIDGLGVLCNAALVAVGVWGIRTAVRTLKAVEKQADEMVKQATLMKEQTTVAQEAANAALLNARAVINAERPWLLIEPSLDLQGMPGVPARSFTVSFKAKNVGRSPAEIIYAALRWRPLPFGDELHEERFFSEEIPIENQWAHSQWKEPNESFTPEGLDGRCRISHDTGELWRQLITGEKVLIVMGFIRYRDAISNCVHESRYAYSVSPKFDTMVMTGPPGYNTLT